MLDISSSIDDLLRRFGPEAPQVVDAIIEGFEPRVFRLAYSILNDPAEAEDAAQDTFLKAVSRLHQYQPETNFKAWLYTIAVNTARGYLRKRKSRGSLQSVLESVYLVSAKPLSPEQARIKKEARDSLWQAVDQLGEKQRLPILLRTAHDLSIAEIAEVLGIKEKTVYSRLYHGYAALKAHLNGQIELEWEIGEYPK